MNKAKLIILFLTIGLTASVSHAQWNFWQSLVMGCSTDKHKENGTCLLNTQSCTLTNISSCSKTWVPASRKYQYTADSSIAGNNGGSTYFAVANGQQIVVNISGSIRLGGAGGYTAPNHTSAYGTSYSNLVSSCLSGAVAYRFGGGDSWKCLFPGSTITNTTGATNSLILGINDSILTDNSGSLSLNFSFLAP